MGYLILKCGVGLIPAAIFSGIENLFLSLIAGLFAGVIITVFYYISIKGMKDINSKHKRFPNEQYGALTIEERDRMIQINWLGILTIWIALIFAII